MRSRLCLPLVALAALSLACEKDPNLVGASDGGGGGSITCGLGTRLEGTVCLPEDGIVCGTGTRLDGQRCVPTGQTISCGAGTVLSAEGVCEAADGITCGTGTRLEGMECVSASDITCGEGTTLNVSGECVPVSEILCGSGTLELDSVCYSVPEYLARMNPIESVEEDDPMWGGTPVPFTLPDLGEQQVFHGTIELFDHNGNGYAHDLDWFEFEAEAGTRLMVHAISDGLPGAAAWVMGAEPATEEVGRLTPIGRDASHSRKVLIPITGKYYLVAFWDQIRLHFWPEIHGSPDYGWYMVLERLPPLVPTDLTIQNAPMTLTGNWEDLDAYRIDGNIGQKYIAFRLNKQTAHNNIVTFHDDSAGFINHRYAVPHQIRPIEIPPEGWTMVVDYMNVEGHQDPTYELQLDPGLIRPAPLGTSPTGNIDPASEFDWFYTEVPANRVFSATAVPTQDPTDLDPVIAILDPISLRQFGGNGTQTGYRYLDAAGDVFPLVVDASRPNPAVPYTDYRLETRADEPTLLGTIAPGTTYLAGSSAAVDAGGSDTTWVLIRVPNMTGLFTARWSPPAGMTVEGQLFVQWDNPSEYGMSPKGTLTVAGGDSRVLNTQIPASAADMVVLMRVTAQSGSGQVPVAVSIQ